MTTNAHLPHQQTNGNGGFPSKSSVTTVAAASGTITEADIDISVDVDSDLDDFLDELEEQAEAEADQRSQSGPEPETESTDPGSPLSSELSELEDEEDDSGYGSQEALRPPLLAEEDVAWLIQYLKDYGMVAWMKEYLVRRKLAVKSLLIALGVTLNAELLRKEDITLLPLLKAALTRILRRREKLAKVNTVDDAVRLLHKARRIIVLTGAGISVSCGIPDFRSRGGLYASLAENPEYDLDDPQQMFDILYFRANPFVFYSFAHKIYPSNFTPSPCHRFIKAIEDREKLLRNYTQNIDTLENIAGIRRVLQCHGSFATASCIECRAQVPGDQIKDDIMSQTIPICKLCDKAKLAEIAKRKLKKGKKKRRRSKGWQTDESEEEETFVLPKGIMKPDITFFGEKLTDDFDRLLFEDHGQVDLLLVIGTSLKVSPVSEILIHLPHTVPQIVINKTPIRHFNPDIQLLGDADVIVQYLSERLDWDISLGTGKRTVSELHTEEPVRVGDSHFWLFEGAEGGNLVQSLQAQADRPPTNGNGASRSNMTTPSPPRQDQGISPSAKKTKLF